MITTGLKLTDHSKIILGQGFGQVFCDFKTDGKIRGSLNGLLTLKIKLLHVNSLFPTQSNARI